MTAFYLKIVNKLRISAAPIPAIKIKDSDGKITEWMHLTPECLIALNDFIKKISETNKNINN